MHTGTLSMWEIKSCIPICKIIHTGIAVRIWGSSCAYGQGSLKYLHMGIPVRITKLCAYWEQHIHLLGVQDALFCIFHSCCYLFLVQRSLHLRHSNLCCRLQQQLLTFLGNWIWCGVWLVVGTLANTSYIVDRTNVIDRICFF
jgi:hypothetical protein